MSLYLSLNISIHRFASFYSLDHLCLFLSLYLTTSLSKYQLLSLSIYPTLFALIPLDLNSLPIPLLSLPHSLIFFLILSTQRFFITVSLLKSSFFNIICCFSLSRSRLIWKLLTFRIASHTQVRRRVRLPLRMRHLWACRRCVAATWLVSQTCQLPVARCQLWAEACGSCT